MSNTIKSTEYFYNKIESEVLEYVEAYEGSSIVDYLSELIQITTYDSQLDLFFIRTFNNTILAILGRHQESLLQEDVKYKDYITSLNMKFFEGTIEWGSSIRFCWFCVDKNRPYEAFGNSYREDIDIITDTEELLNFFTAFSMYVTLMLKLIDENTTE